MLFESFLLNFLIALVLIIALTFDYITKFFTYWYVRHVAYKTPIPFFGSDYHRILGLRSTTTEVNSLYKQYPKEDLVGSVKGRIPDLTVRDPDLIKKVLSTAFESFQSRGIDLCKSKDVCLRNNLFYADGEKWTLLRGGFEALLNGMTFVDDGLSDSLAGTNGDTNVQEVLSKVLDVVYKNLLLSDVNGSVITEIRTKLQKPTLTDKFKNYVKNIFPSIYVTLGLVTLVGIPSSKASDTIKNSKLMNTTESIFQLDKDKNKNVRHKPDDFAFGILSTFISEGYIPTLNLLSSLLYELSKSSEFQKKARNSENYLDAVIKETLRLHPPLSVITRKCVKTYKFPEINDNKVLIDREVTVNVPVEAIHKDDKYYTDAEVFHPDRFLDDSPKNSYAYLPFGAGPRKCVGEQLSLQVLRNVTSVILKRFELEPCEKTPPRLKVTDHNFGRIIQSDIWLKFNPIQC